MIRKMISLSVLLVILGKVFSVSEAYAKHQRKHQEGETWGLEEKFFYKSHSILKHQDKLDLSDEQYETIRDLKLNMKRSLIKQKAEIELVKLDIREKLHDDKINMKDVNELIDRKFEFEKAKDKTVASAIAELKGVLSTEQRQALKDLWKKKCARKKAK